MDAFSVLGVRRLFRANGPNQLFRINRPDAADHAGAEILLDALGRRWRYCLEKRGSELDAMRAVVFPRPARLDELAGRNHRRVAENGDQIALTPRLHPQYAEPVLLVVEGDALHRVRACTPIARDVVPGAGALSMM
jgi:hypothetical protein